MVYPSLVSGGLPLALVLMAPKKAGAHMVVVPPAGVNWNDVAQVRDSILRDYEVTISYRQRDQWGKDKMVSVFGPPTQLEPAIKAATERLRALQAGAAAAVPAPLGGGGGGGGGEGRG